VAVTRRSQRRPSAKAAREQRRYTIDASVFVNAFNPHEEGHAESLATLAAIQERGDPVIVPTLLLPEIAAAVARASDDSDGALAYASATAGLPHLTLVTLTPTMARQAAELAAVHRLRGADSIYVAIARRYGTTLVSRDEEQRVRGSAVVTCQTPDDVLDNRHERKRPRR
jgi:predicted nucleic acid-binding protein